MKKPYFLWDYDLSEKTIKEILRRGKQPEKLWLVGRILEHAHFNDVFKYLDLEEIRNSLPKLRLRPTTRKYWQRALSAWSHDVGTRK
jgi:hypothetical protein